MAAARDILERGEPSPAHLPPRGHGAAALPSMPSSSFAWAVLGVSGFTQKTMVSQHPSGGRLAIHQRLNFDRLELGVPLNNLTVCSPLSGCPSRPSSSALHPPSSMYTSPVADTVRREGALDFWTPRTHAPGVDTEFSQMSRLNLKQSVDASEERRQKRAHENVGSDLPSPCTPSPVPFNPPCTTS